MHTGACNYAIQGLYKTNVAGHNKPAELFDTEIFLLQDVTLFNTEL